MSAAVVIHIYVAMGTDIGKIIGIHRYNRIHTNAHIRIHLRPCICICVYIHIRIVIHICIYARIHVHPQIYIYICKHISMDTHIYICI